MCQFRFWCFQLVAIVDVVTISRLSTIYTFRRNPKLVHLIFLYGLKSQVICLCKLKNTLVLLLVLPPLCNLILKDICDLCNEIWCNSGENNQIGLIYPHLICLYKLKSHAICLSKLKNASHILLCNLVCYTVAILHAILL